MARDDLRSAIGVVSQEAHLFHDTIGANLRYAQPDASTDEVMQACEDAQIMNLIDQLPDGLNTVVGDRGYRLSGGGKATSGPGSTVLEGAAGSSPGRGHRPPRQ